MSEPSPNADAAPPSVDSLQFQTADIVEKKPACPQCGAVLENEYYQLAGTDICPACAARFETAQERPKQTWVMRGFLYGLAAAIGCSILYAAIVWITKFELALMAIVVGYVVGKAVLRGARGLGGRRCQIVAVTLTYFSITTAYVPLMLNAVAKAGLSEAQKKQQGQPHSSPTPAMQTEQSAPKQLTAGAAAFLFVALVAYGMAAPFLGVTQGFSGILGLVIIFIGLSQAWRLTARDERLLMGPYKREESDPAGTTA